jgi:glycosyltransferase involved in cell wall biosynthesis
LQGTINSDNSFSDQEYKMARLAGQSIIVTAPSKWLTRLSSQSRLFGTFKHIHIPYSLDLNVFKPYNKSYCRSVFNLPHDKKILLFVSEKIENRRKGFDLLINALSFLDRTDFHVCAVGDSNPDIKYQIDISFLGGISDERLMALAYSAADCYVLPSREDNLPNVMLESISCGTPVIAFPVGGMLDIVKTGFNGILAKDISSNSLADALNDFLEGRYEFDHVQISETAHKLFSPENQATRYITLYKSMLDYNQNLE